MSRYAALSYALDCRYAADGTVLSATQRWVLVNLARFCDDEGRCWPGLKKLSERTGLTDRCIRETCASLQSLGLIDRVERYDGPNQRQTSNEYYIHLPEWDNRAVRNRPEDIPDNSRPFGPRHGRATPPEPDAATPRNHIPPPTERGSGHEESTLRVQKEEPPLPPVPGGETRVQQGPVTKLEPAEAPPARTKRGRVRAGSPEALVGFDEFWRLFPRKDDKPDAEKAWPRAVTRAGGDPQAIIDGLRARLHLLIDAKERGYCKMPATWLNKGSWENEVPGSESLDDDPPALTGG